MFKTNTGNENIMTKNSCFIVSTLISLIIYILFSLLALLKGQMLNYMITAVGMFLLNELIIFYGVSHRVKKSLLIPICIINYASAMSQLLLGFASVYIYIQLIIMLILVAAVHILINKTSKNQLIAISFAVMVLCLVYAFFSTPVLGAKGWLMIGGISLQLTLLAEVFYVLCIGTIFSIDLSEKSKFLYSLILTVILVCMLLILNNIPIAFLVFSVFIFSVLIIFKENIWKIVSIALVLLLIISGVLGYNFVDSKMYKWECFYCDKINYDTNECVQCGKTVSQMATVKYKKDKYDVLWECPGCSKMYDDTQTFCEDCQTDFLINSHSFNCYDCHFTTWQENYNNEFAPRLCKNCNGVFERGFGKILKKIHDRFSIVFDYDKVQGTGAAYHADMCKKAIKAGGFFGNSDVLVDIPNLDTDSVFAALTNRMGIIYVLALLILFFIIFINGCRTNSPLAVVAVCVLMLQALLAFLGNINLLPMSGVGVPFLSRGGTNLITAYFMIYFVLTSKYESEEK